MANSSSSNSSPNFHLGNSYVSPVRSPANAQTLGGSPLSHAASQSPPPKILHPTPVQPASAAVSTYQVTTNLVCFFVGEYVPSKASDPWVSVHCY